MFSTPYNEIVRGDFVSKGMVMAAEVEFNAAEVVEGASGTGRTEAFSDGVFAIVITLLALELRVPEIEEAGTLLSALVGQWPAYLAFLLSFMTALIMWANHHRMFTYIEHSNFTFMLLNGLLLLGITVVPFATSLMAEYLAHPPDDMIAALVFNGTFAITAVLFNVVWRYALKNDLLDKKLPLSFMENISRQYRFGPLLYLAAFLAALVSVPLSIVINMGLALFFALPPSIVRRLVGRGRS